MLRIDLWEADDGPHPTPKVSTAALGPVNMLCFRVKGIKVADETKVIS